MSAGAAQPLTVDGELAPVAYCAGYLETVVEGFLAGWRSRADLADAHARVQATDAARFSRLTATVDEID